MRILYIDCDTLRPDHLGCYGYHRNTSPNIDRIAAEGMRFENFYCSDAPCLPSRAAVMTGWFGIHSGIVNHGGQCADLRLQGANRKFRDWTTRQNLPWVFRQKGMHTCLISTFGERHSAHWFTSGFKEMHNIGRSGQETADQVTPVALDWIERNAARDDWFLWINYWDAHTNYRTPDSFGEPFANEPIRDWITPEILAEHQNRPGPHCAQEINMYHDEPHPSHSKRHVCAVRTMDQLKKHIDGYDTGIAFMDQHIGQLIEALKARGVWDDLVVIVTADHGENQGELGIYGEHGTADHATCHLPLIVRWPGKVAPGTVDTGLHYNLDLLPTLDEMVHGTLSPHRRYDGQSFAATLSDGTDTGRDQLVISQCAHHCQRSVRWGDWLYMRTWHDGYHLFPREMLYNLKDDPWEQHDLASELPEICAEGSRRYQQWHDEMMATQPEGYSSDPMDIVLSEGGPLHARGYLKKYIPYLEKTGRGWAVPELIRRHPREGCQPS